MTQQEIQQLVFDIRGCCFEIWNEYKTGLSESVYEAALELLLTDKGYNVFRQHPLPCYFKGRRIRQDYRMDLVVNEEFIIELKAVPYLLPEHRAQLFNYANLFRKPDCLIVNFGPEGIRSEWYKVDLVTKKIILL